MGLAKPAATSSTSRLTSPAVRRTASTAPSMLLALFSILVFRTQNAMMQEVASLAEVLTQMGNDLDDSTKAFRIKEKGSVSLPVTPH